MSPPSPGPHSEPPTRAARRLRHATVVPDGYRPVGRDAVSWAAPGAGPRPADRGGTEPADAALAEPAAWSPGTWPDGVAQTSTQPAPTDFPPASASARFPAAPFPAVPFAPDPLPPGQFPAFQSVPTASAPGQPLPTKRARRAGRNLPAAIAVGVTLAATVVAALLLWKPAFYLIIVAAVAVGTWEMVRAVSRSGPRPPLVPLLLGGPVLVGLAWYGGAAALPYGLLGTALAVLVWRLADGPVDYQRDTVSALLIAVYVPFLAGFMVLLAAPDDGHLRVLVTIAAVVLSDTGGYAVGVFLGRRPLAPTVSPAKSWEGFAGSLAAAAVGSAALVWFTLDASWWRGAVFGLAIAAAATLGDLAESMLKRDLAIKDMSSLLPGHGGLMDRLDSILLAAPTAFAVLVLLVPPG